MNSCEFRRNSGRAGRYQNLATLRVQLLSTSNIVTSFAPALTMARHNVGIVLPRRRAGYKFLVVLIRLLDLIDCRRTFFAFSCMGRARYLFGSSLSQERKEKKKDKNKG